MSLDAHLLKRLGTLQLDVELSPLPGQTVALLGPNGAGKSTVLRCLAGLLELDGGFITQDGRVLDEPETRTFVEPDDRAVGMMFQDYLLFAHLDVADNVAFGLRANGVSKRESRRTAMTLLADVGLESMASVAVTSLSGGQAQRVALVRALATKPKLLLLDEPLAALDAGTRVDVRRELRTRLGSFAGVSIIVTHDPVDAFALADTVLVLDAGTVIQQGTLAELAARPANRYVAELVGVNLIEGAVAAGRFTSSNGVAINVGDVAHPDGPAVVTIRPQAVSLYASMPSGSPRNVWRCRVVELDVQGSRVRVRLGGTIDLIAEVTIEALQSVDISVGAEVWATAKATDVQMNPA